MNFIPINWFDLDQEFPKTALNNWNKPINSSDNIYLKKRGLDSSSIFYDESISFTNYLKQGDIWTNNNPSISYSGNIMIINGKDSTLETLHKKNGYNLILDG